MPIPIPSTLVDLVLLGPTDDRRQLQDSPILGDVWLAYATEPGTTQDLLITPHKRATAAQVARALSKQLHVRPALPSTADSAPPPPSESKQIAYLQGLVAARLQLRELLLVIVPMTQWWNERGIRQVLPQKYSPDTLPTQLGTLFKSLHSKNAKATTAMVVEDNFNSLDRYLALAGLLVWAASPDTMPRTADPMTSDAILDLAITQLDRVVAVLLALYADLASRIPAKTDTPAEAESLIFSVSLNRAVSPALDRSVPAVKGDAARYLFKVTTAKIAWAVLDSGIDHQHKAFIHPEKQISRIKKVMDFTRVRQLLCIDGPTSVDHLLVGTGVTPAEAAVHLERLRQDADDQRPIDWDRAEKLITLTDPPRPVSVHGTHVAGIIGAHGPDPDHADGMCPDIQLYDFRVLGRTIEDTEFAVIAALQYIRWVNDRHSYITIHGANLSLSIPHNVRNYACGKTPVCNECQRLIESGVVVVAAAGNRGYQRFETKDGLFENYAAFSITDPGNADDVITVGATHGNWPHTYGVSFFSSRGPTGDGRVKPDLVAPGERIYAPIPGGADNMDYGPESGTSMAAPHVSGAAAMLMARYPELIGNPRRIKKVLCETATDLGRERSFQGHGMLDVLRAFQSI